MADGKPLKRHLDVGLATGVAAPWLVPGVGGGGRPLPGRAGGVALPSLADVCGHDLTGFYTVEIEPRIPEAPRMRLLPGRPRASGTTATCRCRRASPAQMQRQFAPDVDQPWPAEPLPPDDRLARRAPPFVRLSSADADAAHDAMMHIDDDDDDDDGNRTSPPTVPTALSQRSGRRLHDVSARRAPVAQ